VIAGLEVPPEELERRIVARTEAMFEQGVVAEVRAALATGVSRTAAKTLGLDEIATLSEDEARERLIIRTRRYAAYQRKWMRRIPGILSVDGTRPVDEIATAIIEAATTAE
jgi:tRNA dimethylallyltransferase